MTRAQPLRLIVIHRGPLPSLTPDPWSAPAAGRALQLARAIATSSGWQEHGPATLVVRDGAEPVIAAVGSFDEAGERWLTGASQHLAQTLDRIVLLDYRSVEEACHRLATALIDRYGLGALQTFRFTAVPRGGLIVLGLLAYVLDLPHDHLLPPAGAGADAEGVGAPPLVVVDDVALSGRRLSRFIADRTDVRLVIATLHAHPGLRATFVERHPAVEAFLSAHDLRDFAPASLGDDYQAWLDRWRARPEPGRSWIGLPEHVVYPWNEPDVGIWNPVTERRDRGWHLVPPDACLKRTRTPAIGVQLMPPPRSGLAPAPDVVFGEHDGLLVIGHTGTGASFRLDGVGADMWRALMATGNVGDASERLAEEYAAPVAQLRHDMDVFVSDLTDAGLLETRPA